MILGFAVLVVLAFAGWFLAFRERQRSDRAESVAASYEAAAMAQAQPPLRKRTRTFFD